MKILKLLESSNDPAYIAAGKLIKKLGIDIKKLQTDEKNGGVGAIAGKFILTGAFGGTQNDVDDFDEDIDVKFAVIIHISKNNSNTVLEGVEIVEGDSTDHGNIGYNAKNQTFVLYSKKDGEFEIEIDGHKQVKM